MNKFILLLFAGFLIIACTGSEKGPSDVQKFVSQTTIITKEYPVLDQYVIDILEKLQICSTIENDSIQLPPCSNELFRVFKYRPSKNWDEGFIVEMIPGLFNSPVHQIVIIEERMGKYGIVNQYFGKLLELRTTFIGYSDLLIGYDDPDIGLVAIKHVWQGAKYEPVDVEEINNHYVKAEMKDSVNNIFLPAFSAGH